MKKRNVPFKSLFHIVGAGVLLSFFFLAGCAQAPRQDDTPALGKQDGLPANVAGGSLRPGLKTIYFLEKFQHVDEMPKSERAIAKFGRPGPPIIKLDHQFGRGNVFDSGSSTKVGVLMRGYISLDRPGEYIFQAKSNDGVQVYIDGNLIVSDPGVHGDRLSEPGRFKAVKAGMFPLEVKYFQRKGTAMLQLFWQPPGARFYSIVPGSAYSHLGE